MSRTFKGYRVGIIKPDGARRYMKPRSDGKWSLSETKPMLLDEDEMSDALDEVGDFMVGEDVSFSTPVFATRKPKPAPAEGAAEGPKPVAWVTTSPGGSQVVNFARPPFAEERHDGWKVAPLYDEAALAAARREERERTESEVLTFLADAYKANVFKGANETTKEVNRALQAVSEWIRARPTREKTAHDMAAHEAAKGQAK